MYIYFCIYAIAFTWSNLLPGADFAYMQILHPMSKSVHVNGALGLTLPARAGLELTASRSLNESTTINLIKIYKVSLYIVRFKSHLRVWNVNTIKYLGMLGVYGLWTGRDLSQATLAVTLDLDINILI
jgi:hypothetical protein